MAFRFNIAMPQLPMPAPGPSTVDVIASNRQESQARAQLELERQRAEEQARQFGIATDMDKFRLMLRLREAAMGEQANALQAARGARAQGKFGLDFADRVQGAQMRLDPEQANMLLQLGEMGMPGLSKILPPQQRARIVDEPGPPPVPPPSAYRAPSPAGAPPMGQAMPGATAPNEYGVPTGDTLGVTGQSKSQVPLVSDYLRSGGSPPPIAPMEPPAPAASAPTEQPQGPLGLGDINKRFAYAMGSVSKPYERLAAEAQDPHIRAAADLTLKMIEGDLRSTGNAEKTAKNAGKFFSEATKKFAGDERTRMLAENQQRKIAKESQVEPKDVRAGSALVETTLKGGGGDAIKGYLAIQGVLEMLSDPKFLTNPQVFGTTRSQIIQHMAKQSGHAFSDKDYKNAVGESWWSQLEGTISQGLVGAAGQRRLEQLRNTAEAAQQQQMGDIMKSYASVEEQIGQLRGTPGLEGMVTGMENRRTAAFSPVQQAIDNLRKAQEASTRALATGRKDFD